MIEASGQNRYNLRAGILMGIVVPGLLDMASDVDPLPIPDPFNIPNYAGNMTHGASIAMTGAVITLYAKHFGSENPDVRFRDMTLTDKELSRFRVVGTAAIVAAAAAVNTITETRWGFRTFPSIAKISEALSGPQPDIWDGIYSTLWAGICANLFWKRRTASPNE